MGSTEGASEPLAGCDPLSWLEMDRPRTFEAVL